MVLYLATIAFGKREPERAVEYAESASALCEALNHRNEYQHSVLEHSLDAHAWALSNAGRQEEAIHKFQEEVARLDELALFEADPDAELDARIQASGAVATLAHHLAIAGQADDAVAHAHEAVERAQQLRASNPDDPGTLLGLMAAWNGFAGLMLEVNRPGEAIEPAQAALAISRRLEAMQPGDFAPSVSTALERLAISLVDAGRPDEAIEPLNEAVTIQRAVAEGSPARSRRMLASALGPPQQRTDTGWAR
jgi:tetratricopeptide (TPR) repeat protein